MGLLLKRLAVALAVFAISGTAIFIAAIFVFAAVFFRLSEILRPPLAALAMAGALFGFALLVMAAGWIVGRSLRRRPRRDFAWLLELLDAPNGLSAAAIGNLIGRKLRNFAKKNSQAAIIASLAAGLAIGFSPGLRAMLRDWLKE